MTGPEDPAAAGRDQVRVGHAERERVTEALKDALVQDRLTRDEHVTKNHETKPDPDRGIASPTPSTPSASAPVQ